MRPADESFNRMIGILLAPLLAVGVLGVLVARRQVKPLLKLTAGAKTIAAGNYDTRVVVTTHDEIRNRPEVPRASGQENCSRLCISLLTRKLPRRLCCPHPSKLPMSDGDQAQRDPVKQANRAEVKSNDLIMRMLGAMDPSHHFRVA
jgi:HAMP domain-containing protein